MPAGVSPTGRVVSQIVSKFTIVNDPKNKITAKQIEAQQKKIISLENNINNSKIRGRAITKKSSQANKNLLASRKIMRNELALANKELAEMNLALEKNSFVMGRAQAATWGFTAGLAALGATLLTGIKLNIRYIENLNIIQQLFGDNTDAVLKWADTTRKSFGLSTVSALQYLATLKAFTRSAGLDDELGSILSKTGVMLAGDLASFRDVSFDTAFRAIVSGLAGISRTLRFNFGVDIGNEALKERFGQVGTSQEDKIIQRFILLLEKTGFVVGDFERTKNSPANQLKLLTENFKQFAFLMTANLIPIINAILIVINSVLDVLISMNKAIVFIGGAMTIFNIGRSMSEFLKGGFSGALNKMTFGVSSKIGKAAILALQTYLLSALLGGLFPDIGKNAISKEQEHDSYFGDKSFEDIAKDLGWGGGEAGTQSVGGNTGTTINIQGDATTDSVEAMVLKMNKERFNRGR